MFKSEEILKQEEEFFKINDEINKKTKRLFDEVQQIKFKEFDIDTKNNCKALGNPELDLEADTKDYDSPIILPEKNFDLSEYFTQLKLKNSAEFARLNSNSNAEESEKVGEKVSTVEFEKNKKFNLSSKSSGLLTTTNLGYQTVFPAEVVGRKPEPKPKVEKVNNDLIPETVKDIGNEGTIRFLTAKVKTLGDQLQETQKEEKARIEKIRDLQIQKDKTFEERNRLIQQLNSAKNVIVKYEQHTKSISSELQTTQAENGHLKKELESLKKEIRQNKQNFSANEIKLNRTLEEVEKLKSTIQRMKQEEKEIKELNRKKTEDLSNSLKKLDKQRIELLNGFKKQLLVIDNLKKQKDVIEAAKLLKSAEEDFINFLDCNPPDILIQKNANKIKKTGT